MSDRTKKVKAERVIVVGIGLKEESFADLKESLAELEELAYAAGAEVVATLVQALTKFVPATLMGSGKVEEIAKLVQEMEAGAVIVDHALSGSQMRNLEEALKVKVLDRAQLILDIFAQRAQTYEGKLQVELAQLMDQYPRMVGGWLGSLSRLGGGIGTRGPGETALEVDRRRAREKMDQLAERLKTVSKNRAQHRQNRKLSKIPSFALIGYTNVGKSNLLNRLTQAHVLVKDQVFATLDPTTRQVFLPQIRNAVVTDTVGFIRKLPTHLIEAFKATLEETTEADILLHVVDLNSPQMLQQMETVDNLVKEFKWDSKPMIYVFNKIDIAPFERQMTVKKFPRVFVSALDGTGIDKLKTLMADEVRKLLEEVELYFPKEAEHRIYELGREAKILKTEAGSSGTICLVYLNESQLSKWSEFIVKDENFA